MSLLLPFWVVIITTAIWGTVMCFKASIILGVGSLFLQGAGLLEFWVNAIGGYDIAQHLAHSLGFN